MGLDFLKSISLSETPVTQRTGRVAMNKHPENGAQLRLFHDGSIYPSQELVDTYNLEYTAKESKEVTYGFDIIDTNNFPNYPKDKQRLVFVALTPKSNPKVDLFGSVGYNEDGSIKNSVMDQGSNTTGKWLITLLEEVYNVTLFPEGIKYVDLVINTEFGLTTPNNIYHFPKVVSRGDKKGEISFVRRTDTTLWPLTIATLEDVTEEETSELETQTL